MRACDLCRSYDAPSELARILSPTKPRKLLFAGGVDLGRHHVSSCFWPYHLTRVPSDYARITGRSEASAEAWPGRKTGTDRRSRLEQPCLREFQKGALSDVERRECADSARPSPCGSLREVQRAWRRGPAQPTPGAVRSRLGWSTTGPALIWSFQRRTTSSMTPR
jgi:hypothetical protein